MVKFAFAIRIFVIDTVVNEPILLRLWIDVNTVNDTDALDDAMGVATILTVNQFSFYCHMFGKINSGWSDAYIFIPKIDISCFSVDSIDITIAYVDFNGYFRHITSKPRMS